MLASLPPAVTVVTARAPVDSIMNASAACRRPRARQNKSRLTKVDERDEQATTLTIALSHNDCDDDNDEKTTATAETSKDEQSKTTTSRDCTLVSP